MIERTMSLAELCSLITDGKHGDCVNQEDSGFYFLSAKDVKGGRLLYENGRQITEDDFSETHRRTNLKPGDILLTNSGTIGRLAIAPDDPRTRKTTFQKSVAVLKPISRKVSSNFLYYSLSANKDRLVHDAAGAAQKNLLLGSLRRFTINVPDLPTQERIAAILSAYDDLIENNRRRIALLEQAARLLYREWFVHFRFSGHETAKFVDGLPEGWEKMAIGDIWSISYGKNLPTSKISPTGEFPVHGADSIIGYYSAKNVDARLCLVTCRGNGSGNVRRTFEPTFVTNNCFILRPNHRAEELHFHFAVNAMTELKLQDMRTGAAQPQLTLAGIAHVQLPLPSPPHIKKYNDIVGPKIDLSDTLRRQNAQLTKARDLLLPRLMDGRIPANV